MADIYTVTIYKSLTGRFCIRHPKGMIHNKDFASKSYAKKFCKRQGWGVADKLQNQWKQADGKMAFIL